MKKLLGTDANGKESVNEIIVKIEMKKFQNLITNRLERKNTLVKNNVNRVYPLNKVVDGTAAFAEAPTSFKDGITKLNPNLFNYYEKVNSGLYKREQTNSPDKHCNRLHDSIIEKNHLRNSLASKNKDILSHFAPNERQVNTEQRNTDR